MTNCLIHNKILIQYQHFIAACYVFIFLSEFHAKIKKIYHNEFELLTPTKEILNGQMKKSFEIQKSFIHYLTYKILHKI